ncbi:hypothetical protein [Leptospira interrogans]|uniref:Uncharacterized protein n=1 Tax=Leptospira interrogans str. UI 12758 TaxID=1049938 RepID=A0A0E2DB13_LEPIR|nr:hypothetical protein [Leptospira interrogans]EKR52853.1 hypothetical protein LEP1GSC105_0775 [Leptospira interrogans str. UI 12758]
MQTEDLELDQTRGVYFPTALRLELKTSGNLENLIGSNYEEVFIQEFIHFIQDISTLYGLTNFQVNLNDFASKA